MVPDIAGLAQQTDRPDADILAEINDRLWQDEATRAMERSNVAVRIRSGRVFLAGHVTNQRDLQLVADLVGSIPGVQAIHNALVADQDLVVEVAQALAADARTRPAIIRVGASHGWIQMAGEVPDEATRRTAEEVAASVARVRGVLGLPHLPDAQPQGARNRRSLQPRVGAAVYATDGTAGRIELVVISRRNRLVSHLVVAGAPEVGWLPVRGAWVVPVEAVAHATEGGVFLTQRLAAVVARTPVEAVNFELPPPEWRLPFPYEAGEVRWLIQPAATPIAVRSDEFFAGSSVSRLAAATPVAV
jgi:osmotically-inducible protein OsmY